jgi:hypothetical protein
MNMETIARLITQAVVALLLFSAALFALKKLNIPLGYLAGDQFKIGAFKLRLVTVNLLLFVICVIAQAILMLQYGIFSLVGLFF